MLGPAIFRVTRAVAPPVIWMMPLPAKSCMPHPRNALLLKATIQLDELQMRHITTVPTRTDFAAASLPHPHPRCSPLVCFRGGCLGGPLCPPSGAAPGMFGLGLLRNDLRGEPTQRGPWMAGLLQARISTSGVNLCSTTCPGRTERRVTETVGTQR